MRTARVHLCAACAAAAAAAGTVSAAAGDSTLSSSLGMPGPRRHHTVSRGTEQQPEPPAVRYAQGVPHLEERNDISTLHLDIFILKNLTVTKPEYHLLYNIAVEPVRGSTLYNEHLRTASIFHSPVGTVHYQSRGTKPTLRPVYTKNFFCL